MNFRKPKLLFMKKFFECIKVFGLLAMLFYGYYVNGQLPLNLNSQPQFLNPLPIPFVIDGSNGESLP